jgi:hypothetical protein
MAARTGATLFSTHSQCHSGAVSRVVPAHPTAKIHKRGSSAILYVVAIVSPPTLVPTHPTQSIPRHCPRGSSLSPPVNNLRSRVRRGIRLWGRTRACSRVCPRHFLHRPPGDLRRRCNGSASTRQGSRLLAPTVERALYPSFPLPRFKLNCTKLCSVPFSKSAPSAFGPEPDS